MQPRALYVHLPFCLRRCGYCDFLSLSGPNLPVEEYVGALVTEMDLRAPRDPQSLDSVYLGGGTPSFIAPEHIARILGHVAVRFGLAPDAEVTIEANPESTSARKLAAWRGSGCNRISLGAQSLLDEDLRQLDRPHTALEVRQAVVDARRAGFDNLGLDLIWAVPGSTPASWERCLAEALALRPEHLSTYSLTFEAGTRFSQALAGGRIHPVSEEAQAAMYEHTLDAVAAAGRRTYEISNHSLPGRECAHNLAYWRLVPYIGVGLGAHSFDGHNRRWANAGTMADYLGALADGRLPAGAEETLSPAQQEFEFLFLSLRRSAGIDPAAYAERFDRPIETRHGTTFSELSDQGLIEREDGAVRLTRRGRLLSDVVFTRLAP